MKFLAVVMLQLPLIWAATITTPQVRVDEKKALNSRIVGGEVARSDLFPYAAAVYRHTNNGIYFCGGTLLTNDWILTAGSCVPQAVLFTIQLGSIHLNDDNALTVAATTYELHPDYNEDTKEGDIALIELRMPISYSDYLHPVETLANYDISWGASVRVAGWGATSNEAVLSSDLQYVFVSVLRFEDCQNIYGSQIAEHIVCVEGNYNEGLCAGDIGGPLTMVVSLRHSLLVGVGSFVSSRGCETTDPSGFVKVIWYRDWIVSTTNYTDYVPTSTL